MKRIRAFSCLFIAVLLVSALVSPLTMPTLAEGGKPDKSNPADLIHQLELAGRGGDAVWKSFSPEAQAEVIKYLHLDADNEQGEIISLTIVPAQSVDALTPATSSDVSPLWGCSCFEIRNIVGPSAYNEIPPAALVQGWGPGTLTLSATKEVSNKWYAEGGVSSSVVSAKLGFEVTWSNSWTYGYETTVPAGQMWEIDAYNYYYHYIYDVYYNPLIGNPYRVGSGWADQFKGITYVVRRIA